jgi:hypothetical protein
VLKSARINKIFNISPATGQIKCQLPDKALYYQIYLICKYMKKYQGSSEDKRQEQ